MNIVFLDYATFNGDFTIDAITKHATSFTGYDFTNPEQVVERCLDSDVVITNKVEMTAELMANLPKLKLVCVAATGTNNIDLVAAKQHGIIVCNAKGYAGPAVAQYIFAQLLAIYQDVAHHNKNTKQGKWSTSPSFCLHGNTINELNGKTIGILGYGHIGKAVANIASAFGMEVIIAEQPNASKIRTGRVPFETMLSNADIISLHCPLTSETQQLINQQRLSLIKPSAVLINTARGGLIDNQALADALANGQLGYAILDVLDQEPPPESHPLLSPSIPNIAITGHIAWASQQAQQRILDIIASNIHHFKQGQVINQVTFVEVNN